MTDARRCAMTAKAHAMSAKLLTASQFAALARCRTVGDAAAFLASTEAYGDVFAGTDPGRMSRARLEYLLECDRIDKTLRLKRYASGGDGAFFDRLIAEYELKAILSALRTVLAGGRRAATPVGEALLIPPALAEASRVNIAALYDAADTAEFFRILGKHEFAEPIAKALSHAGAPAADSTPADNYSRAEAAAYRRWYDSVRALAATLGADEERRINDMMALRADRANAQTALRIRRFAAAAGEPRRTYEDIEPYLMPHSTAIRRADIERIISAPDEESVLAAVPRAAAVPQNDLDDAVKALRRSTAPSLCAAFAYLTLLACEDAAVIRSVETIRYA